MDTTPRHGDSDNILLKKIAASVDGGGGGGGGGLASDAFLPPIGSIIAWMKGLPGRPALSASWAECNGQTLVDAGSPFNGQELPDLNGIGSPAKFLRGSASGDGTVGGSLGVLNSPVETTVDNDGIASTTSVTGLFSDVDILPPFFEIVWVLRVK